MVSFSLVSTAQLPALIRGVNIAAILPAGVTVATDSANIKQISVTALVAGNAVVSLPTAERMVLRSYSSAGSLVRIAEERQ
jgi:hypothetical protein